MAKFTGQDRGYAASFLPGRRAAAVSTRGDDATTSPGERFLLFVTPMLLPFENHFQIMPNVSILFLMYIALAGYVAVNRLRHLDRICMHPVFVAAYLFIGICVALEYTSPLSSYVHIASFALMIGGALLVASLCRDRAALKMLMYGYIAAAVLLGVLLVATSYGTLSGISATDYREAGLARRQAFSDSPIYGNLNTFAVNCVQGGIVALALSLGSRGVGSQKFFTGVGIFCMVASALPMSRGATVNALVSFAVVLRAYGMRQGKAWLLAGLLVTMAILLVPNAIWSRMTVMTEEGVKKDARLGLYESAIQHVDDYWFTGVGAGNYFQKWGLEKGFLAKKHAGTHVYVIYGVHNSFLQLLINWGIIGLSAYLVIICLAYRCLPHTSGKDGLEMGILGIAVTSFMTMFFMHNFGWKQFSVTLGMLVAYQCWQVPRKAAQLASRKDFASRPQTGLAGG